MTTCRTYFTFTYGCQMNQADSERVAGDYESRGYRRAASVDEADEIVINTCSVRQSAEDRVMGLLYNLSLRFKAGKSRSLENSERPGLSERAPKIILTGCMLHYGVDKLRRMLPTVDEFLPISEVGFNNPSIRQDLHHAWVPISSGCNSYCTFCIVPLSRGRERSRPAAEIAQEIKDLVERGYRSVTLLGQNVNSYGLEKIGISLRKRLDEKREIPAPQSQYKPFKGLPPFVKLLKKLCRIKELGKINFITSNPWDFYEELIDFIADHPQIERQIHLPVQSGDNEVLRRMNRGYTREQYLTLIDKIRKKVPEAQFGTDIIVGFPGETKEQFENTLDLCKQVGFKIGFIARYSPRPGTASAKLFPDDIPYQEKKRRWKILDSMINGKKTYGK